MGYTKTTYNNIVPGNTIATPGGDVTVTFIEDNETSITIYTGGGGIIIGHPSEKVFVEDASPLEGDLIMGIMAGFEEATTGKKSNKKVGKTAKKNAQYIEKLKQKGRDYQILALSGMNPKEINAIQNKDRLNELLEQSSSEKPTKSPTPGWADDGSYYTTSEGITYTAEELETAAYSGADFSIDNSSIG